MKREREDIVPPPPGANATYSDVRRKAPQGEGRGLDLAHVQWKPRGGQMLLLLQKNV